MTTLVYERSFSIGSGRIDAFWKRLNSRETFVRGQLFPYRVEFEADSQSGPIRPGELNIHHGPLLSAQGAITELTPAYRGLQYFYGSYVISFRLVRPERLEFFREAQAVRVRITYFVAPWFVPVWRSFNRLFWSLFAISV